MEQHTNFDISWGSLWKIFFLVVFAVGAYLSIDILVAVFLAIVLSSGLNPFVSFFERIKIPRVIGAVFVFLLIFLVFTSVIYVIVPIALQEINGLLEQFFPLIAQWFGLDQHKLSNVFVLITEKIYGIAQLGDFQIIEFSKSVVGNITLLIAIFSVSFYLTVDNYGVEKFLKAVLPARHEQAVVSIFLRSRKRIGYWLQAQILLSLFVGAVTYIGLFFLGVDYALILGVLAAVFEIIPFVGPIFVGTIAIIIALGESNMLALYTLILFVVIQQAESDLIIPLFMKKAIGIHPVMVLVALLLGAKFFGFIGLILAVPATVVFQEFIDDWAAKKAQRQRLV